MKKKLLILISLVIFNLSCIYVFADESGFYQLEIGIRYKDVNGNRYKVSEYDYYKKEKLFPYFGATLEKKLGEDKYLSLNGKFVNEFNQQYDLGFDCGRILVLEGNYIDFYHNLKRDAIISPSTYYVASSEAVNEYGRRNTDLNTKMSIKIPDISQAKINLAYRQQNKRGQHQGILWTNCGSCHFYTSTRSEDKVTRTVEAGVEGNIISGVSAEYKYENRQFREEVPGQSLPSDITKNGTYPQSGDKYDFTPNQTANTHEIQTRVDLPAESTVYGGYTVNEHRNADNSNTIKGNAGNVRVTNNLLDNLTVSLYYNRIDEINDVAYTYGTLTTNDIYVSKSHYTTANAKGLDLKTDRVGIDTSYSAIYKTTIRMNVETKSTKREDNPTEIASNSIDTKAKISILSRTLNDASISLRYTYDNTKDPGYAISSAYSHKGFAGISWNPIAEVLIDPSVSYAYGKGYSNDYEKKEMTAGVLTTFMPTNIPLSINAGYTRSNSYVKNDIWWTLVYASKKYVTIIDYGKYYMDQADTVNLGGTYSVTSELQLDLNTHLIYSKGSYEITNDKQTTNGKDFYLADISELSRVDTVITGFSVNPTYDLDKNTMLSLSYLFNRYQDKQDDTLTGTEHSFYGGIAMKF